MARHEYVQHIYTRSPCAPPAGDVRPGGVAGAGSRRRLGRLGRKDGRSMTYTSTHALDCRACHPIRWILNEVEVGQGQDCKSAILGM